jgi:hypothetical protein
VEREEIRLKNNAVWDIYILGVEQDGKRAIRAKTITNGTQEDVTHILLLHINYVIHTTTSLRLPQSMPLHAAPRKSVCISDFMLNRGDNIKMDLKEMGCDDVDCITWLMVSRS